MAKSGYTPEERRQLDLALSHLSKQELGWLVGLQDKIAALPIEKQQELGRQIGELCKRRTLS